MSGLDPAVASIVDGAVADAAKSAAQSEAIAAGADATIAVTGGPADGYTAEIRILAGWLAAAPAAERAGLLDAGEPHVLATLSVRLHEVLLDVRERLL